MYKVFVNDKLICFTNKQESCKDFMNCLVLNFFQTELTILIVDLLEQDKKIGNVVVLVDNVDEAFDLFKSHFKLIKAAGGIVTNSENKKLFIYRLDRWDLPKGKIEKNENNENAAIREVMEECGIKELSIQKQLEDTFHIYAVNEKVILKQTFWFDMKTSYDGELVPQTEESITEVCWFNEEEIKDRVLKNTYGSIAELIKSVI